LSSKNRYWVPCPDCKELQVLKWSQLKWGEDNPLATARYACEHCGSLIEEYHKTWMLDPANGAKWIAEAPEVTDVCGFHVNCLYTPIGLGDSWGKNAKVYDEAKHDPSKLKVFQNTRLGETHKDPKEKLEWEQVWTRREPYKLRQPPHGVLVLTAGVDVQKNYLAICVVGWTRKEGAVTFYLERPAAKPGILALAETAASPRNAHGFECGRPCATIPATSGTASGYGQGNRRATGGPGSAHVESLQADHGVMAK
jgi:hypothetical protein